jgi:predicted protein tyrosine phosphatase
VNKKKILFICDENRLRSPTAQSLYSEEEDMVARSAGLGSHATIALTEELLEWADLIFVMERRHRNIIHKKWPSQYKRKQIICLYIPDEYDFMDPVLVGILVRKLEPYIGKPGEEPGAV